MEVRSLHRQFFANGIQCVFVCSRTAASRWPPTCHLPAHHPHVSSPRGRCDDRLSPGISSPHTARRPQGMACGVPLSAAPTAHAHASGSLRRSRCGTAPAWPTSVPQVRSTHTQATRLFFFYHGRTAHDPSSTCPRCERSLEHELFLPVLTAWPALQQMNPTLGLRISRIPMANCGFMRVELPMQLYCNQSDVSDRIEAPREHHQKF